MKSMEMSSANLTNSEVDQAIEQMEKQFIPEESARSLGLTAFEALATQAPIANFGEDDAYTICSTGGSGGSKGGSGASDDKD